MDYYLCKCCLKTIPATSFAAIADASNPVMVCNRCMFDECSITGCKNRYMPKYQCEKLGLKFRQICAEHVLNQCRHSIDCHNPTKDNERFCDQHRCVKKIDEKTSCISERIPEYPYCAYHLWLVRKENEKKYDTPKAGERTCSFDTKLMHSPASNTPTSSVQTKCLNIQRAFRDYYKETDWSSHTYSPDQIDLAPSA